MNKIFLIGDFLKKNLTIIIILFIALYTIAALLVTLNRYWQYQVFYFDFGIFDMAVWRVAHFQPPLIDHYSFSNNYIWSFADHFSPSVFLLSPLYWFTSRSEVLIIAQVLAVSIASFIIYLTARPLIKSKMALFSLVFIFLMFVGLQNALISDVHEITYAVLPLTLLFWSYFNKKWKLYFLILIILLGFKESVAGLGVCMGIFIIVRNFKQVKKREQIAELKIALLTVLISFIWGIVAIKVVIPHFSQGIYLYAPTSLPTTPMEFLNKFTSPPIKLKTLLESFLSFGFLPLFDISILPAILENFFERFVLTASKGQDLGMHYSAPLSPLMTIGVMNFFIFLERIKKYRRFVPFIALLLVINSLVLHRFILRGPLGLAYNRVFYEQNDKVAYVNNMVRQLPHNGLILTQNDLAVRLTHYNVKLLRPDYRIFHPDHVILNLTPGQNPNVYTPLTLDQVIFMKDELLKDKDYIVTKYADELYVFSKVKK